MERSTVIVEVEGRRLTLSNLHKVLYPATGTTKAEVIDYYRAVAPVLLPHLRGRPPTLVRAPDGVEGERFFEKRCPRHRPDWVRTAAVGDSDGGRGFDGCLVEDLPTLIWLANLAALELHTHQATVDHPDAPDGLVLDLDPGPGTDILDCARVALDLRELLAADGLGAGIKTSGKAGLHLRVPLPVGSAGATAAKGFARHLGTTLATREPDRVTTTMAKRARVGRVFVDWSQNDRHKTTVAPYSLRIAPRPRVSAPVTWQEVEDALAEGDPSRFADDLSDVVARVERDGDLWSELVRPSRPPPALPSFPG